MWSEHEDTIVSLAYLLGYPPLPWRLEDRLRLSDQMEEAEQRLLQRPPSAEMYLTAARFVARVFAPPPGAWTEAIRQERWVLWDEFGEWVRNSPDHLSAAWWQLGSFHTMCRRRRRDRAEGKG